jgi:hypothetical protein
LPVFAVGLDGKCGTGQLRPQGGPHRNPLPAAAAPVSGIFRIPSEEIVPDVRRKSGILIGINFRPQGSKLLSTRFLLVTDHRGPMPGEDD